MTTTIDVRKKAKTLDATADPTTWNDVYMRKALDDSGIVPYSGASWTGSPDIIPNGTNVLADPVTTLTNNYGSDPGQATTIGQPNYFYVRGKNLYSGARTATFELYYCPAHLFLFPSLWNTAQLQTSSGKTQVSGSAANTNDIVVPPEPFVYIPVSEEHSCLISRLTTPGDPNPLPDDSTVGTMDLLGQFIVNHPDFAWRNVVTVDATIPTFTHQFNISIPSAPGSGGTVLIGISYTNLSVGSQLAFSAGTPIPSGPNAGQVIQLVQTAVAQQNGSLGTNYLTLPAGYTTTVNYSYFAQTPVLKNWSVEFFAILITPPSSALFQHAKPLREFKEIPNDHPLLALDVNGISRGVKIGSIATVAAQS